MSDPIVDTDTPILPSTDTVGPCTVRWSPTSPHATAEKRAEILAKMRNLPKHRRRPAINHDRARAAAQKHGADVLQATAEAPSATARCIVRVYYRSMGGEILAFDAGPMTSHAADRMQRECTEAIDTDRFVVGEDKHLMRGARLVVLPSQHAEPVQTAVAELELEIPVAEPTPVAPPAVYPVLAPVVRVNLYGVAMARRAARQVRAA